MAGNERLEGKVRIAIDGRVLGERAGRQARVQLQSITGSAERRVLHFRQFMSRTRASGEKKVNDFSALISFSGQLMFIYPHQLPQCRCALARSLPPAYLFSAFPAHFN